MLRRAFLAPVTLQTSTSVENTAMNDIRYGRRIFHPGLYPKLIVISKDDTLLPILTPQDYPDINVKPTPLRSGVLVSVIIFNVLCLTSILVVLYRADSQGQYHTHYDNIYPEIRYVPTIIGTVTKLIYQSVMGTYFRMERYISVADKPVEQEDNGTKDIKKFEPTLSL